MKITIDATNKEVADLVLALQGRQEMDINISLPDESSNDKRIHRPDEMLADLCRKLTKAIESPIRER